MKEAKVGQCYYHQPVTAFAAWLMEESGAHSLGECLGCLLSGDAMIEKYRKEGHQGVHEAFGKKMGDFLLQCGASEARVHDLLKGGVGGDLSLSHWVEEVEQIFYQQK